jgi:hypothetical protein
MMKRKREEKEVGPNKKNKRAFYIGQTDLTKPDTLYAIFDLDKARLSKGLFSQVPWKSRYHYNPALILPEVSSWLYITGKTNKVSRQTNFLFF